MAISPFYTQIHATKRFRLLTRKSDPSGNIYIYLKGVASTAAGDFVTYDKDGVTARSGATSTGAVAIAMSANTAATTFSWYMIRGYYATANVATHSSGSGKALFVNATASRATSTPLTEGTIMGAFTAGNSTANVGPVYLGTEPFAPGDIST